MTTAIEDAVKFLSAGKLVAFPTETVYGLGADASQPLAVEKVFQAKNRPPGHPLIVHLSGLDAAGHWALGLSGDALRLAQRFWPGPLTLVLPKRPHVLPQITGGQETIGLRVPRHPIAQALLHAFGGGIAAPSANQFTRLSPTTAAAVRQELGQAVDMVLDGGACEIGLESTVLDMAHGAPVLLRPGAITAIEIEEALGRPVLLPAPGKPLAHRAPGSHPIHYAPRTATVLVEAHRLIDLWPHWLAHERPFALLARQAISFPSADGTCCVAMPEDAHKYAHVLYHILRKTDNAGFRTIFIENLPSGIEWAALRDRLTKATAPRGL